MGVEGGRRVFACRDLISQEAWTSQKPELVGQGWEHVRLWHMVAWVTFPCSELLALVAKPLHPLWLRYYSTPFSASYINIMQLTCYMLIFHCVSQLISSELLIFSCLYVFCLFRQKTGWAPVIKSLSLDQSEGKLLPPGSQENLTFRSPTHTHWMAVLSPVQIWKREKDIASEGGWGRVKWKDIPVFGCRVGRRKEYEAAEQTSTAIGLHLCALHFSSVCFLS